MRPGNFFMALLLAGIATSVSAQDFSFTCETAAGGFLPSTGEGNIFVDLIIDENVVGSPTDTQGFSMGIRHEEPPIDPIDVQPTAALLALNGGAGPDFFAPEVDVMTAGGDPGLIIACIFNFALPKFASFPDPTPVATVCYDTIPASFMGQMMPVNTNLTWSDELIPVATPVINTVVDDVGDALFPTFVDCTVTLLPEPFFLRGDANADGDVNVADAVFILNYIVDGGDPICLDALDVNDNGAITVTDGFHIICYLFCDPTGAPPAPPFPGCGVDLTADAFICDQTFPGCPGCP